MPINATKPPSVEDREVTLDQKSGSVTPNSASRISSPSLPVPQYQAEDEEKRASTPDVVKVVRSKKKGSGKSKKRVVDPPEESSHG